ncbi:C39 family peptidase [Slackia faecicanis]|uniref:C39 family peptidase n=1 Tax=Slackia faecicanis TaxID=255723 RepID=UPI001FCEEC05|nr:C39 family peptidase [Slackia faecicanis]
MHDDASFASHVPHAARVRCSKNRQSAAYTPRPLRIKRHHPGWTAVAVFAVVAAIASCGVFAALHTASEDARHALSAGAGQPTISTPKSEWKRDEIPYLYQTDPAWAAAPYAGTDVLTAGCGPACMTMVYVGLTGKTDYDPASMAAFSEANGFVDSGMTAWLFMTQGAAMLGLHGEELPADENVLTAALREGRPVIASVRPGDFTTVGHFIVIAGIDDAGDLIIRDPNSPEHSAQTWNAQRILSQCANLWAFGAR